MEETKLCPRCERILPLDSFSKNSSRPDGLQAYCRDCQKKAKPKLCSKENCKTKRKNK